MSFILARHSTLATCTVHDDCLECPEMAALCFESSTGRTAGVVEYQLSSWEKPKSGEVTIATFRGTHEYNGTTFHTYFIQTESYVGRVVATESHVEAVMSDVWDDVRYAWCAEEDGSFTRHCYGCASDAHGLQTAVVDAPPELIRAFEAWQVVQRANERKTAHEAYERKQAEKAAAEAAAPRKGKSLEVVKGRKVPIGTKGVCIWVGQSQYGERVGLKDSSGTVHWTASTNVKVV